MNILYETYTKPRNCCIWNIGPISLLHFNCITSQTYISTITVILDQRYTNICLHDQVIRFQTSCLSIFFVVRRERLLYGAWTRFNGVQFTRWMGGYQSIRNEKKHLWKYWGVGKIHDMISRNAKLLEQIIWISYQKRKGLVSVTNLIVCKVQEKWTLEIALWNF